MKWSSNTEREDNIIPYFTAKINSPEVLVMDKISRILSRWQTDSKSNWEGYKLPTPEEMAALIRTEIEKEYIIDREEKSNGI